MPTELLNLVTSTNLFDLMISQIGFVKGSMSGFWENTRQFVNRHRGKLIGALVVGIGGLVYYNWSNSQKEDESNTREEVMVAVEAQSNAKKSDLTPIQRSRALLEVREQFEIHAMHHLPLLRTSIHDIVDISHAVEKIREIRSWASTESKENGGYMSADQHRIEQITKENKLWEEIKVTSITSMFVTVYMLSIICALLRIQLHIVASYNIHLDAFHEDGKETKAQLDSQTLDTLIEETYTKLYSAGLKNLTSIIRQGVGREMSDLTVRHNVAYETLIEKIENLRKNYENDIPNLINALSISPETQNPELLDMEGKEGGSVPPSTNGKAMKGGKNEVVHSLLCRTWDIVDSNIFVAIFTEAVNTSFRHIFNKIRVLKYPDPASESMVDFFKGEDSYQQRFEPPKLAKILPKVKSIALDMLPKETEETLTLEAKEVAAGPVLNTLCEAVFDAST